MKTTRRASASKPDAPDPSAPNPGRPRPQLEITLPNGTGKVVVEAVTVDEQVKLQITAPGKKWRPLIAYAGREILILVPNYGEIKIVVVAVGASHHDVTIDAVIPSELRPFVRD